MALEMVTQASAFLGINAKYFLQGMISFAIIEFVRFFPRKASSFRRKITRYNVIVSFVYCIISGVLSGLLAPNTAFALGIGAAGPAVLIGLRNMVLNNLEKMGGAPRQTEQTTESMLYSFVLIPPLSGNFLAKSTLIYHLAKILQFLNEIPQDLKVERPSKS